MTQCDTNTKCTGVQIDSDEALGSGELLAGKRVLFLGAGEAGTGIGELIAYCVHRRTGCSMQVVCSLLFAVCVALLLCVELIVLFVMWTGGCPALCVCAHTCTAQIFQHCFAILVCRRPGRRATLWTQRDW